METKTVVKVEKTDDKKADTKIVSTVPETKTVSKATQEKPVKEVKSAVKETKPAAKKTTKSVAKTEKPAAKETKTAKTTKTAAKKTTAKASAKPVKAAADKKVNTFLQFGGHEYDVDEVIEKVKAAAAADTGKKTFKSLDIYVKPEENVAYYVVNGKPGSVQL